MPSLVAGLAALASLAVANPIPGQQGSTEAFSIEQVPLKNLTLMNGPAAYLKSLQKFNMDVPAGLKEAAAAAVTGSVPASPEQYDQEYLCAVQIGTPAQTLMLDFDSGSSDLWTYSSLQPASQRSGHSYYTPGSSSTSKQLSGETWSIRYADGSGASGVVYSDKVVIGGVTATSQAVEAATSVSTAFQQDTDNDGLVGLAFDSINTARPNQVKTFMDNVGPSLSQNLFAAYLKYKATGAYDFGFINSARYTGSISYVPVNTRNGFWEFTAGAATANGASLGTVGDAIADTGTSIILTTAAITRNYYSRVSGATNSASAGGYIFPCSATLPNFAVTIGSQTFTVPGSYINYAPLGNGQCFGGIQSGGGGMSILGDVFLKATYAIFDIGNTRLGFAKQA